jgi:hypothetical protein
MPLVTNVTLRVKPNLTKVVGDQTLSELLDINKSFQWLSGIILDQADRLYYAKPTIAGSATLSLDLAGALLDIFGDPFTPVKLKLLLLANAVANINTINLQRPATNGVPIFLAVSDGEPVHAGGFTFKAWPTLAGIPVTAATADLIDVVNTAAGTVTPEILLIGASA